MKNKLFVFNIITYIILNFIIVDVIVYNIKPYLSVYGQLKYINEGVIVFDIEDFYTIFAILGINTLISTVFFYVIYRWHLKEKILKTFSKLIISFIVINPIVFLMTFNDVMYGIMYYIACILIPLLIMVLLMLPLFWLNKKLIERINSIKLN